MPTGRHQANLNITVESAWCSFDITIFCGLGGVADQQWQHLHQLYPLIGKLGLIFISIARITFLSAETCV